MPETTPAPKMTWEQMYRAIQALAGRTDVYLNMSADGGWYMYVGSAEIKDGSLLESVCGRGVTPVTAVTNTFDRLIKCTPEKPIVLNAMSDKRRQVIWNGFMWEDVP